MSPRCFCLADNRIAHNARHVSSWVGCYFLTSFFLGSFLATCNFVANNVSILHELDCRNCDL